MKSIYFKMHSLLLSLLVIHFVSIISQNESDDLYAILGVSRHADFKDIRRAYKKLAVILHPDKNMLNNTHDQFLTLTKAYDILKNHETRKQYDLYGNKVFKKPKKETWKQEYHDFNYFYNRFGYFDDDFNIIDLTTGDFEINIRDNGGIWFIFFYNPHCDKCYNLKDVWKKLANELDGVLYVAAVNCKEEFNLCSKLGFIHVPKFVIFHENDINTFKTHHDSIITLNQLHDFAMQYMTASITEVTPTMWRAGRQTQWVLSLCQSQETDYTLMKLSAILEKIVSVGRVISHELCNEIYSDYKIMPLIFWHSKYIGSVESFAVRGLNGKSSRELADEVLNMLPNAKEINSSEFEDIKIRLEHGSEDAWLFCFYLGDVSMYFMHLKRLPAMLPNMHIGTISCAKNKDLCYILNIGHYPSWGILKPGGSFEIYYGRESLHDIVAFVRDGIKATNMKYLTDVELRNILRSGAPLVTVWTVSWCASCRNLLQPLRRSSYEFINKSIQIGVIDCVQYRVICLQNGIENYPTIRFHYQFKYYHFFGPYTKKDISDYIKEMLNPLVFYLSEKSYKSEILDKKSDKIWFILYYSPYCSACHNIHTLWRKLSLQFSLYDNVKFGQVDCKESQEICQRRFINFYPTIHVYPSGSIGVNTYDEFKGNGNYDSILNWLNKFIPSPVKFISGADLAHITRSFISSIVLFYTEHNDDFRNIATEIFDLAKKNLLPSQVHFHIIDCESQLICKNENVNEYPSVVLYDYGTRRFIKSTTTMDIADEVKSLLYLPSHDEL